VFAKYLPRHVVIRCLVPRQNLQISNREAKTQCIWLLLSVQHPSRHEHDSGYDYEKDHIGPHRREIRFVFRFRWIAIVRVHLLIMLCRIEEARPGLGVYGIAGPLLGSISMSSLHGCGPLFN
jgi:hypothetical protein